MTTSFADQQRNIVDIFTGKPYSIPLNRRFIRLAPEFDGLEMLYSNESHSTKFFSIKVLCWALRADGQVVGVVPWLDGVSACPDIQDPLNGKWEGYYDPDIDEAFFETPIHKAMEVESAAEYYQFDSSNGEDIAQEIPDTIGTHAILSNDGFKSLTLKEVVSWQLLANGTMSGMVVDEDKIIDTPILPGDQCLYPAQEHADFHYYFQHNIANKIKAQDPEAMAAIAILVEP